MTVDEAIDFLQSQDDIRLLDVAELLERLPITGDGYRVLPGDLLKPKEGVDYLCGFIGEPSVVMHVHYILDSGQHVTDEISNYYRGDTDG